MKTIKLTSRYEVGTGAGQIHLLVRIGNGQFGSSTVVVGPTLFDHARTFDQDIGTPSQITNQSISVVSVVTDTNQHTNRTSVTYELTGGPHPFGQTSEVPVDDDGDSVMYIAEIQLVP